MTSCVLCSASCKQLPVTASLHAADATTQERPGRQALMQEQGLSASSWVFLGSLLQPTEQHSELGSDLPMMKSGIRRCTWCSSHRPSFAPPACAVWRSNSSLKKGPTLTFRFLLPRPCCRDSMTHQIKSNGVHISWVIKKDIQ